MFESIFTDLTNPYEDHEKELCKRYERSHTSCFGISGLGSFKSTMEDQSLE